MNLSDVLIRPLMTEKTEWLRNADNKYAFEVAPRANKELVRQAVKTLFEVEVDKVNIINVRGRKRRYQNNRHYSYGPAKKKAIVTLKQGEKIDIYEGS